MLPIRQIGESEVTEVDTYWGARTVTAVPFRTAFESRQHLKWRSRQYPLFEQLMGLYGDHTDEVILDYGCGPGNDLLGFLDQTTARKVIGIDISDKALMIASRRLTLHNVEPDRVELIKITDATTRIPLDNNHIDYIYCGGVLHHTSDPEALLREFYRVLKPGSEACIMVYNYNSVWLHLFTAFTRQIVERKFQGLDVRAAFSHNTDGEDCPISRCFTPDEFISLSAKAGFQAEFIGGYLSHTELDSLRKFGAQALSHSQLDEEHKMFLRNLDYDERGYPQFQGKYAGIGGVYRLLKQD